MHFEEIKIVHFRAFLALFYTYLFDPHDSFEANLAVYLVKSGKSSENCNKIKFYMYVYIYICVVNNYINFQFFFENITYV